jgi:PST family polysaccharide transporter
MLALFSVQVFRKLMPVITMPYLARVLGATGWGTVAFVQGFATCLILLVEFGFYISGTREVARWRESREKLGEICSGVLGAQILLALTVAAAVIAVHPWIPILRDDSRLMWSGLFYGIAEGMNPAWYFLGLERMRTVAILEITCKTVAAVGMFTFVRTPADAWIVLTLMGLAPLLSTLSGMFLIFRSIPFRLPSKNLIIESLHRGWPMFLFRSAAMMYTMGNAFILGLFAAPAVVGYFAAAEKISRAVFGLFDPVRESLYPRLSHLVRKSPAQAKRLARWGVAITGSGGLLLGVLVFVFAPLLVRALLGGGFQPAINVLRILALLPPLIAVTQSMGYQWLLPHGRERTVNRIIIGAGLLNVTLAVFLAPRFAHIGMALAVVCSEVFVATRMLYTVVSDRSCQLFSFGWFGPAAAAAVNETVLMAAAPTSAQSGSEDRQPLQVVSRNNSRPAGSHDSEFPDFGAFVISLDLELHWGIRDECTPSRRRRLAANREVVYRLLTLFDEFDIAATWAAVGFLFAKTRNELNAYTPIMKPTYQDAGLYPYQEPVGTNEEADPLHYAPSLLAAISSHPRQEIATHTFSHYYCLESGQTKAQFDADIASAIDIARKYNLKISSIVFPRNQCNPDYFDVLKKYGIICYRGNESAWMYRGLPRRHRQTVTARASRLVDSYINVTGDNLKGWHEIVGENGLCNVPSSRYLRPHLPALHGLDSLRLKRITDSIQLAATEKKVFHLWWHPHDFGLYIEENFAFLRKIMEAYVTCRDRHGMRSLSMAETAYLAREAEHIPFDDRNHWGSVAQNAV